MNFNNKWQIIAPLQVRAVSILMTMHEPLQSASKVLDDLLSEEDYLPQIQNRNFDSLGVFTQCVLINQSICYSVVIFAQFN